MSGEGGLAGRTVWSGVFGTWEEAQESADAANSGATEPIAFDSDRWMERQSGMVEAASRGEAPRHTTLPVVCALGAGARVVDLGGGSGWTYFLLRHAGVPAISTYEVVETASVVRSFSSAWTDAEGLSFVDVSGWPHHFAADAADVLYSNSALQYLPDDQLLTDMAKCIQPKLVLIDDYQASTGPTFFSLQHYYETELACRFSDPHTLKSSMQVIGYSCVGEWEYPAAFSHFLSPTLSDTRNTGLDIGRPLTMLFIANGETHGEGP